MMNQLLIAQPPLQVMPALAEAVGFNEAAVLQITHYWLSPTVNQHFKDGCYWVQNLAFHLHGRFFFWGEDTIGYMIAQFEQSGILIVRHETLSNGAPVTYHTINYDRLEQLTPEPGNRTPAAPKEEANSNIRPTFSAEIRERGHNLYVMMVEDRQHFLACELTLEVQARAEPEKPSPASEEDARKVVCHFPRIDDQEFRKFVWNNPTLYEILLDAFHMKIMKQLLSFCLNHHATNLTIFADDSPDLKIYREFLAYSGQTPEDEVVIPREAFDAWMEFMAQADIKLQQVLWRKRKDNPAIQNYLKYMDWPEM